MNYFPNDNKLQAEIEYMRDLLSPLLEPVEVPASLNSSAMLAKLRSLEAEEQDFTTPFDASSVNYSAPTLAKNNVKAFPFTHITRRVTLVAAGLVLVICLARYGAPLLTMRSDSSEATPSAEAAGLDEAPLGLGNFGAGLTKMNGYGELPSYLSLNALYGGSDTLEDEVEGSAPAGKSNLLLSSAMGGTGFFAANTKQVNQLQTDGDYLYALNRTSAGDNVAIIDTNSFKLASTIPLEKDHYFSGIMVENDSLLLIDSSSDIKEGVVEPTYGEVTASESVSVEAITYAPTVRVVVYDVTNRQNPQQQGDFVQTGDLVSVHLDDNNVYLASNQLVEMDITPDTPISAALPLTWQENESPKLLPAEQIYMDYNSQGTARSYAVLSAYSLEDSSAKPTTTAVLGTFNALYQDEQGVCLVEQQEDTTRLIFFQWMEDALVFQKEEILAGNMILSGGMAMENNILQVLTDTESGTLYSLNWETLGSSADPVGDLAPNATIQSVTFADNTAWVVAEGENPLLVSADSTGKSNTTQLTHWPMQLCPTSDGVFTLGYADDATSSLILGWVQRDEVKELTIGENRMVGGLDGVIWDDEKRIGLPLNLWNEADGSFIPEYGLYQVNQDNMPTMVQLLDDAGSTTGQSFQQALLLGDKAYIASPNQMLCLNWQNGGLKKLQTI